MKNNTKIKVAKKYQPFINEIDYWGGMYSMDLIECCDIDGGQHLYNYDTQKELLQDTRSIFIIPNEKEYIYYHGEDLLEEYRESYKKLMGKYPPVE